MTPKFVSAVRIIRNCMVEIYKNIEWRQEFFGEICCLPSQEGSGLKRQEMMRKYLIHKSSLARGKWIEAFLYFSKSLRQFRLPSQEGSGLKQYILHTILQNHWSSLARGKWIEATDNPAKVPLVTVSSLARGKWIEAVPCVALYNAVFCLPSQEGSGLKRKNTMP